MKPQAPRVVVIGSASVGKTSLINRIVSSTFSPTTPTTGTAFFQYKGEAHGDREIQIWDTAGMERYRSVNNVFYREAVAALLVFDLSCYTSFEDLEPWLQEFIANARPNASVLLCGNKCDRAAEREVEDDEIVTFCRGHGDLNFFEVSALSGEGVDTMMKALFEMLPKEENPVEISDLNPEPSGSKCC